MPIKVTVRKVPHIPGGPVPNSEKCYRVRFAGYPPEEAQRYADSYFYTLAMARRYANRVYLDGCYIY